MILATQNTSWDTTDVARGPNGAGFPRAWPHPAPPGAPGPKQLAEPSSPCLHSGATLRWGGLALVRYPRGVQGVAIRSSLSGSRSADAKCLLPQATRVGARSQCASA